jgi:hypothetical protein
VGAASKTDPDHEATPQQPQKQVQFAEAVIQEAEVLEKFEKRFGKSLPLECVNVLILMDNTMVEEAQQAEAEGGLNE